MSGCKIPCIDPGIDIISTMVHLQGNKRVGLGSCRELPDTLRVYYNGSGLLQWDIALAEYLTLPADTLPYIHKWQAYLLWD